MSKRLEEEVKGGFYPVTMTNETQDNLQRALDEGLVPVKAVHQKIFSGNHRLFAVPTEDRKHAQTVIRESIEQFKILKSSIAIGGKIASLYVSHDRNRLTCQWETR
jgi:hypothetical protein